MNARGTLWAITCLFNPAGFRVRTTNYHIFRKAFPLPLLTIELAFDGNFVLNPSDADVIVQIEGGDRMWQKERLLNLALQSLPKNCSRVIWVDADIVVPDPQLWIDGIESGLEHYSVVQAFSAVKMRDSKGNTMLKNPSTMASLRRSSDPNAVYQATLDRSTGAPCSGHVWAARREVLSTRGFYDGCIIGGGDSAFICAALGDFDRVIHLHGMGDRQKHRYLNWAQELYTGITDGVGYVDHEIDHLWHGTIGNRRGAERHAKLNEIGFDPYVDICLNHNQIWEWATPKPELHNYVRNYFHSRQEDQSLEEQ